MKFLKSKFYTTVALILLLVGCADLEVQNLNAPTTASVAASPEDQAKLLVGGFLDMSTAIVSSWGVNMGMIADQYTSTNNFRNFWDFTDEPRRRLNNATSYASRPAVETYFYAFNSSAATANIFINNIVNDGLTTTDADGNDITNDILAQAYFLRGVSRGYLGMIYDRSYLSTENIGESSGLVEYPQLIEAALSDLDNAIQLASNSNTFVFNTMPNTTESWTGPEFVDIVNTFAAKIAAGEARTAAERDQLDWNRILNYARNGLGGPNAKSGLTVFKNSNIGSSGEFANYLLDWSNFIVAGSFTDGAGYNPTDVKVIHSMDPTYPVEYPAEFASGQSALFGPAASVDPRLEGYFKYTNNAGFLNSTRNGRLYSNYFSVREYADNDWWQAENDVILTTSSENLYLLAEAQLMTGDLAGAAATLNASPAGTGLTDFGGNLPAVNAGYMAQNSLSGGHVMTGSESVAEFQWALNREYGVEIGGFGGIGTQWFFMRRHDLLQAGSVTMFPVPGAELELLLEDNYTYGGAGFENQVGTASGANSWKTLAQRAFPGGVSKARVATSDNIQNVEDAAPANVRMTKGARSN